MNKRKHYQDIVDYYVGSEIAYKEGWDLTKSMAIHYGYYDDKVGSFTQALVRTNEVMSEVADIKESDFVLDAGCGVGGSCIYLSQQIGCDTTGITLTPRQVELAQNNAEKYNVADKTTFEVKDYTDTNFPNNSFDVVWALESVCHAIRKEDFISEAYRLLKPGGRLIMADYFMAKENLTEQDQVVLDNWFEGWSLPHLDTIDRLKNQIETLNMRIVHKEEATDKIMNSANRMYYLAILSKIYTKMMALIGIKWKNRANVLNAQGAYWQKKALNRGLWKYQIVCAVKS